MRTEEPLFFDTKLTYEKIAMEAKLSDNEDTWVQEVLQELHKQHPFLGTYDVTPVMTEVDGEQGYGIGYFKVSNKSARPPGPANTALAAGDGVRSIRVPIVIKERKLQELDVFQSHDGKAYPLNEERVRAALFRPHLFDSAGSPPGDVGLVDKLYPPGRSYHGAGTTTVPVSETKISHVKPEFLMEAIGDSISAGDIQKVEDVLNGDMKIAHALLASDETRPFMEYLAKVAEAGPVTAADAAKVVSENIFPDVYVMTRKADGYHLKMASSRMFAPEEVVGDRLRMIELVGETMVKEADVNGVSVVSTDPVTRDRVEDEEIDQVERFGEYRVKTKNGQELLGWVFPKVIDFDGTALDMVLFTNGAVSAMQSEIAGSPVGKSANIIRGPVEGAGFFYRVTKDGGVIAFAPGKIVSKFEDEGKGFLFESVLGDTCKVRPVPGLNNVQKLSGNEYAVPGDIRWAPMNASKMAPLAERPEDFNKIASAERIRNEATIVSDGTSWSVSGAGTEKLASQFRESLGGSDMLFMACAMGVEPNTALEAMAIAGQRGKAKIANCREIMLPIERINEARKDVKPHFEELPTKHLLLKEAAALDDAATVDKVLSLGFINPENVSTFIEYLPEFERSICKLAEMLVAVRVGLKDVPENAVKNAMERTEEVTQGLKKLLRRDVEA